MSDALEGTTIMASELKCIGYIGLGNAGYALCTELLKHLPSLHAVVRDIDDAKAVQLAKELGEDRVTVAKSGDGPGAFKDCQVVVTMLPNGDLVRDVLLGNDGIAAILRPGSIFLDTSSADPFNTQSMSRELSEKYQISLVDAAVTQAAQNDIFKGKVTFFVGGEAEAVKRVDPLLRGMGQYLFHMGGSGSGHIAKTLNNYTSAASIAALSDSLVMAKKMGLDPLQLVNAFALGTAQNYSTTHSWRPAMMTGKYDSGYSLPLLAKDLAINERLFRTQGAGDSPLPRLLAARFDQANKELEKEGNEERRCHTSVIRLYEKEWKLKIGSYDDLESGKYGDPPEQAL